jgi:hypothetical protein
LNKERRKLCNTNVEDFSTELKEYKKCSEKYIK